MYCETCPVRNYCRAYEQAERDNETSYHPQQVTRVGDCNDLPCPLLAIVEPKTEEA